MGEYIERGALEKAVYNEMRGISLYHPAEFLEVAESVPAADVRPVVRGQWIDNLKCSNCGQIDLSTPNFCPNCGADMRTDEN